MNNRIKELAEQARDWGHAEHSGYTAQLLFEQKFAQLIVQECIECADFVGQVNIASGYPNSTAHHVKQKIKQHFGVEE